MSLLGYWVVALIVGLESLGLPLPGETILVLAAIYAATGSSFNIWAVIVVDAFGAIIGDNSARATAHATVLQRVGPEAQIEPNRGRAGP